jgi:Glycine rich protein
MDDATKTAINDFYSGTYISCRKYLNDADVAESFTISVGGTSITVTIDQVAAKCKSYDATGSGIAAGTVALQGSDTNALLLAAATGAFTRIVWKLVSVWLATDTIWRARGFTNFPTISGVTAYTSATVNTLRDTATYAVVTAARNAYKTAWDTLMPRLTEFVRSRLQQTNTIFRYATEPTGEDVPLSPSLTVKGLNLKTTPFVQTLPVVVSGTSNMCGGIVVSDGGQTLTERGIMYGSTSNFTFGSANGQLGSVITNNPAGGYSWSNWKGGYSNAIASVPGVLNVGSNYWVRPYVRYASGGSDVYAYGNSLQFMAVGAPTVAMAATVSITNAALSSQQPQPNSFDTHTFTSCGATGAVGPTIDQCKTTYTPTWKDDTNLFNVSSGIQRWKVPITGQYLIEARGGDGGGRNTYRVTFSAVGGGGLGASVANVFNLIKDDVIYIVVGQNGSSSTLTDATTRDIGGAGGGASYVYKLSTDEYPLIVAGGGSGASCCVNTFNSANAFNHNGGNPATRADGTNSTNSFGGRGWLSLRSNPSNIGSLSIKGGFGGGGDSASNGHAGGGGGLVGGNAGTTPTAASSWNMDPSIPVSINSPGVKITYVPPKMYSVTINNPVSVTAPNGVAIVSRGVVWTSDTAITRTYANITADLTTKAEESLGLSGGTITLTGLLASTTYRLRGYAKDSSGTVYYNATPATEPTIKLDLPPIPTITLSQADVVGDITKRNVSISFTAVSANPPITEYGVVYIVYNTTTNDISKLTIGGANTVNVTSATLSASAIIDKGCTNEWKYVDIRPYVKNAIGITYGTNTQISIQGRNVDRVTFRTLESGTLSVTGDTSIRLSNFQISNNGGDVITDYGMIWWVDNASAADREIGGTGVTVASVIGNPQVNTNLTVDATNMNIAWPASGTGSTAQLIRVRAYARNCLGYRYGPLQTIKMYKYVENTTLLTLRPGTFSGASGPTQFNTNGFPRRESTSSSPEYPSYTTFLPNLSANQVASLDDFAMNQGIQTWTIPRAGVYKIEAWGGTRPWNDLSGGSPKQVGYVIGHFKLVAGKSLSVIVGQGGAGGGSSSGGSGATTVYYGASSEIRSGKVSPSVSTPINSIDHHLLMVAGGTAGTMQGARTMTDADEDKTQCPLTLVTPNMSYSTAGGTQPTSRSGGGGGGFTGDGNGDYTASGGRSVVRLDNNSQGGPGRSVAGNPSNSEGGFGGGGAAKTFSITQYAVTLEGAGGGGGFSGGNGNDGTKKATGGTSFLNTTSPLIDTTRDYSNKPGGTAYALVNPGGANPNAGSSMVKITWITAV